MATMHDNNETVVWPKRAVVTAGMPYGNKPLHFGHIAGVFVPADCFARFLRDRIGAENVRFISGTDCFGSPINEGYRKLVEAGEVRQGLWFARAALSRDKSREDAYAAVMRAQIASLQRSAALETYFSCRKFLSNDLGIDPSAETMRLYHSIIDAQEEVA